MCYLLIEGVSVDKPGGGADDHEEVTGGDGHQDRVGRGQHPGSEGDILSILSLKHILILNNGIELKGNIFMFPLFFCGQIYL